MKKNVAVIVAGGSGSRMGTAVHKQFLELRGKPILAYTLETFQNAACIDGIILVVGRGEEAYVRSRIVEKYGFSKVTGIVAGGAERYESVYAGLKYCELLYAGRKNSESKNAGQADTDPAEGEEVPGGTEGYVFVQDAVRPFVTEEILERGLETARTYGSAVCGVPSKDTVKITDPDGVVRQTPSRDLVWIVQTPQIFPFRLLKKAYDRVLQDNVPAADAGRKTTPAKKITDDAMIVESTGQDVHMFMGDYRNIKITTPEDLLIAEAFL